MKTEFDCYYTPDWLAEYLAGLLPSSVRSVIDLAAGQGALLEAANYRFPNIVTGATDIDPTAVSRLQRLHPQWTISRADALTERSYRASSAFTKHSSGYDSVLLNPPFSYRGQGRRVVSYDGATYRVTPSTAFVRQAFDWLAPAGVIVAIVPSNIMNIEGDREIWSRWKSSLRVETKRSLNRNTFAGARTSAMVVVISPSGRPLRSAKHSQQSTRSESQPFATSTRCVCVDIVRGRVPVHRASSFEVSDGAPFVHTTALRTNRLALGSRLLPLDLASEGPFVLLPRVGRPSVEKVVESAARPLVLSDCVLGLRALDRHTHRSLFRLVNENFDDLTRLYTGSCAPYLTIERLRNWLVGHGLQAGQAAASAEPGWCSCRRSAAAPA